jgi:hypothetical protein
MISRGSASPSPSCESVRRPRDLNQATRSYMYALLLPVGLWAVMRYWAGVEGRTAVDLISLYGYSMVVWIPVAVRLPYCFRRFSCANSSSAYHRSPSQDSSLQPAPLASPASSCCASTSLLALAQTRLMFRAQHLPLAGRRTLKSSPRPHHRRRRPALCPIACALVWVLEHWRQRQEHGARFGRGSAGGRHLRDDARICNFERHRSSPGSAWPESVGARALTVHP